MLFRIREFRKIGEYRFTEKTASFSFFCIIGKSDQKELSNQGISENRWISVHRKNCRFFVFLHNRKIGPKWTSESRNFGIPIENVLPNQGFSENWSKMLFWIREFQKIGKKWCFWNRKTDEFRYTDFVFWDDNVFIKCLFKITNLAYT